MDKIMLNEEKIRLMTELAVFEKEHAVQMKNVTTYFKGDYISRNLIRGFISFTICSALLVCLWILFNVDIVLSSIDMDGLKALAMRRGAFYFGGLVVYETLIGVIYGRRYDYDEKMKRIYIVKLKHLDKRYEFQKRSRALAREERNV